MSTPFLGPDPDSTIAADGYPRQTAPLAGSSDEGTCTGTRWYDDFDRRIQQAESVLGALGGSAKPWQPMAVSPLVPISQRMWFSGHWSANHRMGFRVECVQESLHDDECRFPEGPVRLPDLY